MARLPSSGGIAPFSALLRRSRVSSLERFASAGGIAPFKRYSANHNCDTRFSYMSMPSQALMAMSGDQFRLPASPASVSFVASRVAQSDTRAGLSAGLGTATALEHWAVYWGAMGTMMAGQNGKPISAISSLPKGARRGSGMQPVSWLPLRRNS